MITFMPELSVPTLKALNMHFFQRLSAKRALRELGPNDPKLNMKMAESWLTISAENFKNKWNFDPIDMKPLPGKYIWSQVISEDPQDVRTVSNPITDELNPTVLTCPTIPKPEISKKNSTSPCRRASKTPKKQTKINRKRTPRSNRKIESINNSPRQAKITEYGSTRKRLYSSSSCKSDEDRNSPSKKQLLEATE